MSAVNKVNFKRSHHTGKKYFQHILPLLEAARQGLTPSSEWLAWLSVCLPQVDTPALPQPSPRGNQGNGIWPHPIPVVSPTSPKCSTLSQVQQGARAGPLIPKYCIPLGQCAKCCRSPASAGLLPQLVSAAPLESRMILKTARQLPASAQDPGAWFQSWVPLPSLSLSLLFLKIFYLFLERGREGEREREKTSMCGCLPCTPVQGPGLQARRVP